MESGAVLGFGWSINLISFFIEIVRPNLGKRYVDCVLLFGSTIGKGTKIIRQTVSKWSQKFQMFE